MFQAFVSLMPFRKIIVNISLSNGIFCGIQITFMLF